MLLGSQISNVGVAGMDFSMAKVRISYTIGNSNLKPAMKLEIGQWWLYRDSKTWDWPLLPKGITNLRTSLSYIPEQICAVVITDLASGVYGGQEVKVEFMLAEPSYSPYEKNDTEWFIDQNFDANEGYFIPFWDPNNGFVYQNSTISAQTKYGVDCVKCKNYYPHAIQTPNFECWGCKNGF